MNIFLLWRRQEGIEGNMLVKIFKTREDANDAKLKRQEIEAEAPMGMSYIVAEWEVSKGED